MQIAFPAVVSRMQYYILGSEPQSRPAKISCGVLDFVFIKPYICSRF